MTFASRCLQDGVPVTLLVDLLDAKGPDSRRIFEVEREHGGGDTVARLLVDRAAAPAG